MKLVLRRRLWRERRRLAVCGALLLASAGLLAAGGRGALFGLPAPWGMILLVAGGLAFTAAVSLLMPAMRQMSEAGACGLFLYALLRARFGLEYGAGLLIVVPLLVLAGIPLLRLADRRLLMRSHVSRVRGWSPLGAQVLWDGLVGTAPHADRMAIPAPHRILSLENTSADGRRRQVVICWGDLPPEPQAQEIVLWDQPRRVRMMAGTERIDPRPWELEIRPQGRGHRIEKVEHYRNAAWYPVAMDWIDDGGGRFLDAQLALIETRATR